MVLEFESPEVAGKIMDSIKIDNDDWISAKLQGNRIICEASSDTIGGMLHTAEDFLSCLALAEKMIKKK